MNRINTKIEAGASDALAPALGRKICIVTGELEGPFLNGGVGTTNRALAVALRELGHDVDILYTLVDEGVPVCLRGNFADHRDDFRQLGINLVHIDNRGDRYQWAERSYLALQHLLQNWYDLVFFDDMDGTGYYPLLARRTGNAHLSGTKMCVTAHSAFQWLANLSQTPIRFEHLPLMEMERRSLELADVVRAPSAYILRKYKDYGWNINDHIVLPNFVSSGEQKNLHRRKMAISEIVFFGRLERRKGLELFCRALDRLKFVLAGQRVTFLGKASTETARRLILKSAEWPFPIRLLNNFNRDQALGYLKGSGRLAVMASFEDNSPSTIIECIEEGIPFLASSGSGGEELLDEESRAANLFEPSVAAFCAKLLETLAEGGVTATPSLDQREVKRLFVKWLNRLFEQSVRPRVPRPPAGAPTSPVLMVVVPSDVPPDHAASSLTQAVREHGDRLRIDALTARPEELKQALGDARRAVNVSPLADFASVAESLTRGDPSAVGVCHVSQILPASWIERAQACFAADAGVSAITGMVASAKQPVSDPSTDALALIDRYLVGYAPQLFSIMPSTNSGFMVIRSDVLRTLRDIKPFDEQYGRLKMMQVWVHEMLVTLHMLNHRFELVPDLIAQKTVTETPHEAIGGVNFIRSIGDSFYAPGTDQSLIARLGIDTGLQRERFRRNDEYRRNLGVRIGREVPAVNPYTPWGQHLSELAMVAHGTGQIDLAVDLATSQLAANRGLANLKLTEYVNSSARSVKLMEWLSTNRHQAINLSHSWSFRPTSSKEFELHANAANEGRAALAFPAVDLAKATSFRCSVTLLDRIVAPIRIRVDLIPIDRSQVFSADMIARAGENIAWDFDVPPRFRGACTVIIAVEMADQRDNPENAYVRIGDPHFVRDGPG